MEGPCVNCGAVAVGAFCAGCGQRTPTSSDYTMRSLLIATVGVLTNYDDRLLGTLRSLFVRPGLLPRDHFEGRRARHLDPFRFFVLANVSAWFLAPHTNLLGFSMKLGKRWALCQSLWSWGLAKRASLSGLTVEEIGQRIDVIANAQNTVAVLCLVPLLALSIWAVMARRGYRFVHHLVFAAYFYGFHLACVLVYLGLLLRPLYRLLLPHTPRLADAMVQIWWQHLALAPLLIAYLYSALRRAYGLSARESSWRAGIIGVCACTLARLFFDIAFALALVFA